MLKDKFKKELRTDLIFNYISFAVLAISGITIDSLIAYLHGVEILGVFNQISAIYVITAQFAVGGVHFSALKHLAQYYDDTEQSNQIFLSAIFISIFLGIIFSLVIFLSRGVLGYILERNNPDISYGIGLMAFALVFFSVNKTILSSLNGQKKMKIFAIGQSLRYILIVLFVVLLSFISEEKINIVLSYLFSEILLFLFLISIIILKGYFGIPVFFKITKKWIRKHLVFGAKGFAGGVLIETNSRVDILMLGIFADDKIVGIYSLAARLAEGFYNLLIVLKRNYSPILVDILKRKNNEELSNLLIKTRIFVYPIMLILAIIGALLFPIFIDILKLDPSFHEGLFVLVILFSGIVISSGYVPFDNLLIHAGLPWQQTKMYAITVSLNIILNAVLIPIIGMYGAAAATAIAYVFLISYLIYLVNKKLRINLI